MEQVVNLLAGWAQGRHWRMEQVNRSSKSNTLSQQRDETEPMTSNTSFSCNLESMISLYINSFEKKKCCFLLL